MRIKNAKLEWYAFRYDSNTRKLVFTNVLAGSEAYIAHQVRIGKKAGWRPVYNYETFKEFIKADLMYHYWSKAEHETVIGGLFHHSEEDLAKHDIWWQLEPNLDRICEYIIREMRIKFEEDKADDKTVQ